MKKTTQLFILLLALVLGATSCSSSNDGTCVKEIVEILQNAYTESVNDSTDTSEPNMVVSMLETSGDIFMAPEIWKIINDNQNYKLTLEDKAMLQHAVSLFGLPKASDNDYDGSKWGRAHGEILAAKRRQIQASVADNIETIKNADKLKDLLK